MTTIFLFCALVGGTIMLCQFVLTLLGLGGHDLVDAGHGGVDLADDAGPDVAHAERQEQRPEEAVTEEGKLHQQSRVALSEQQRQVGEEGAHGSARLGGGQDRAAAGTGDIQPLGAGTAAEGAAAPLPE